MKIKVQPKQIVNSYNETIQVVEGILVFVGLKDVESYIHTPDKDALINYIVWGANVPIIISETEPIEGGDLVYDVEFKTLHTVKSRYTVTDFDRKVLVSPSNFTSKQIEAIASKRLRENDLVFIKCTTRKDLTIEIDFGDSSFSKKITLVRVPESLQFSRKRVKEIANWAFSFHRKEDLNNEELEVEFKEQLEKKLNGL